MCCGPYIWEFDFAEGSSVGGFACTFGDWCVADEVGEWLGYSHVAFDKISEVLVLGSWRGSVGLVVGASQLLW